LSGTSDSLLAEVKKKLSLYMAKEFGVIIGFLLLSKNHGVLPEIS
jgi:hypothetical protein